MLTIFGHTASGASKARQLTSSIRRNVILAYMSSTSDRKSDLIERLLNAKSASKLSFDEIAQKLGITNAQTAQLFTNQAQLSPRAAGLLKAAIPSISHEDLATMQKVPMRSFDPQMMQVTTKFPPIGSSTSLCWELISVIGFVRYLNFRSCRSHLFTASSKRCSITVLV